MVGKSRSKRGRRPRINESLVLEASLEHTPHPVTRELQVHSGIPLDLVHRVLQRAFGWDNAHLYQFEVGDVVFSETDDAPDFTFIDAAHAPLGALVKTGSSFKYRYDFGDDWKVTLRVTDLVELPPGTFFRCTAGQNAGPPEDCGGPHGFADLVEVLRDKKHPDYRDRREWVGARYDPMRCDLAAIEKDLAAMRKELMKLAREAAARREVQRVD